MEEQTLRLLALATGNLVAMARALEESVGKLVSNYGAQRENQISSIAKHVASNLQTIQTTLSPAQNGRSYATQVPLTGEEEIDVLITRTKNAVPELGSLRIAGTMEKMHNLLQSIAHIVAMFEGDANIAGNINNCMMEEF